jgi:hypothetical protein
MWKQILFLTSITALTFSLLPYRSSIADAQTQSSTWQQPYTLSRLQWLSINLKGRGEEIGCGVTDRKGAILGYYSWQNVSSKDDRLILSIISNGERNWCMMQAFSDLRLEAFRIASNPPPVELQHFQITKQGRKLIKTYQCTVPAATTAKDFDIGRFENLCK